MQTFGELLPTDLQTVKDSMEEEHTYTLKDARDEQDYTIAKLKDGKIWMTKNLNLAGGTEITAELSDIPANYTLPTANGFQEGNRLPESSQTGFSDNAQAYVYNTGNNTDNCASPGCYSYYSWHAATAGSGVDIATESANAPHSICPKGWKLPSTYNGSGVLAERTDTRALLIALGGSNSIQDYNKNTSPTGSELYSLLGPNTTTNLLLTGLYENNSLKGENSFGYYWSSTSGNTSDYARTLYFDQNFMNSAYRYSRRFGFAVRCLAK